MIKPGLMLTLALFSASGPSLAAPSPDAATTSRIARACTAKGAFGETYGTTLVGKPGSRGPDMRTFTPQADYAPFKTFVALLTPKSERVAGVSAVAELPDSREAVDWAKALLTASGQDLESLFEERPGALVAELTQGGSRLEVRNRSIELFCVDSAQLDAAFDENNDKPRPPHRTAPLTPSPGVCDRPETRDKFLAALDDQMAARRDDNVELVMYVQRMQFWAVQQRDLEVPETWWSGPNDPAILVGMARVKDAHKRLQAMRGGQDHALTCANGVQILEAADETYDAYLAFLDARLAQIAAMPQTTSPPSP